MTVFLRLTVAMLAACLLTGLLIGIWAVLALLFEPHWIIGILFMLWAVANHLYLVRRAYLFVQKNWF